jgi:hypothetical protein
VALLASATGKVTEHARRFTSATAEKLPLSPEEKSTVRNTLVDGSNAEKSPGPACCQVEAGGLMSPASPRLRLETKMLGLELDAAPGC